MKNLVYLLWETVLASQEHVVPCTVSWQEFSMDGLPDCHCFPEDNNTASNSTVPTPAAVQQFHASKTYSSLSPSSPLLPQDLVGLWKSLTSFSFKEITSGYSAVRGEWDFGNFNVVQGI